MTDSVVDGLLTDAQQFVLDFSRADVRFTGHGKLEAYPPIGRRVLSTLAQC